MKDITEDKLVLYYYNELSEEGRVELERLLESDFELRKKYSRLCQVLNTVDGAEVPVPDPDFESRIWTGLSPHIAAGQDGPLKRLRRWLGAFPGPGRIRGFTPVTASAVLLAVVAAYVAGRSTGPAEDGAGQPQIAELPAAAEALPFTASARQRVLLASVSDHLEQSGRLFKQVVNIPVESSGGVMSGQELAESLLASNRIYRAAAERSGEAKIVQMLDIMEPILLELARRSDDYAGGDFGILQQRIEENDLLFKVKATRTGLIHSRPAESAAGAETT